jgi:3-hydroxybutyryl-CoA dehydratase
MANPIRKSAVKGLREGDSFNYKRVFTREDTVLFGDLTRDYNPVHYDARWAGSKGFRSEICHGLLVGSMICEFGGQVGWLATGMNFKFIKPVPKQKLFLITRMANRSVMLAWQGVYRWARNGSF